ncbi:YceI family protein [Robertkochia solimangrovi]|uniref:YceI family protein n=1 Tax=Robertkochia solimangrovi TaxID=2213046 RepID=UPI00118106C2|nr:YceI family protein [Robertkochia solimangrovi]TRZ43556.1 hypothetical protein DMZ48_09035 [Robertkochia solimangrovi]
MTTKTKTRWIVDPTHSEIGFKVKHMMFTNVSGKFEKFEASVESDNDDFEDAIFTFKGETKSINTGNGDRDTHLRSGDFFDAEEFPIIGFESTSFKDSDSDDFIMKGILTIKEIANPITLHAEFMGTAKDPWGNLKAGFSMSGKINRKDWGLNWNSALEAGGVLVGEEIRLLIDLQFIKE